MVFQKGQKAWNKGLTKETDNRISNCGFKKGHKSWNIGLTKETDKRLFSTSKNLIGKKKRKQTLEMSKEHGEKIGRSIKKLWKTIEYREKIMKTILSRVFKRPTSFEQKIILLCSKYHLPFIYTGDGRILINFKNPDFVDERGKIIIEVFLDYFKIRDYGSIEKYMEVRSENFAKAGYKTIFISEKEITDKNWEKICLDKINKILEKSTSS